MRETNRCLKNKHEGQMRVWVSNESHRYLHSMASRYLRKLGTQLDLIIKEAYFAVRQDDKKARDRRKKLKG